jgi:hypothetical protein
MSHTLARWLIAHAARRVPAALAERLEEEWLAALAERRGAVARLALALGCSWAAAVIAREQCLVASTAAASPAIAVRHGSSQLPRRTAVLLAIVFLHVLLISALVTRLAWGDGPPGEAETTMVDLG